MDRDTLTLLSLWVHIPLVTAWIGLVMFDVFAALAPGLTTAQRGRLITWSRPSAIASIVIIIVTGIWQTMENPLGVPVNSYSTLQDLRERTYGLALFYKHVFVFITFGLTVLVRFVLAPRLVAVAAAASSGDAAAPRLERSVLWLSVLNLAACLGALVFATRMVWELH